MTGRRGIRYLLASSRPRFWLYLAGPLLVGVVYGAGTPGEALAPLSVALFLYFLVPANVFLYGLNDVFDADVDEANPKKGPGGREVRFGGDRLLPAAVVASGALALPLLPLVPPVGGVAMAGFLFLGIAYSAPPLRLKTTPLLDSVSNGLYVLPAVVGYVTVAGARPPALAILGGWLWAMAMHTFSAVPDVRPDRAAGIRTTATVLGERKALAYCGGCWLLAALAMGLVHPALGALFGVYPAFLAGIVGSGVDVGRAYWWFPVVNTATGMALTLGGIWVMVYA